MSTGEASGTAAAISIRDEVKPRALDGSVVKKALEESGVNIRPDESLVPKKCMLG
jgi:hypothetical protein